MTYMNGPMPRGPGTTGNSSVCNGVAYGDFLRELRIQELGEKQMVRNSGTKLRSRLS